MNYPCVICETELIAEEGLAVCSFCGQESLMEYRCPHGHAVCEDCQLATPVQVIERVCAGTREQDPVAIANLIFKHPGMIMHGPYHHQLIAPVLLTALSNSGQIAFQPADLPAALKRTADIPAAVCGLRGDCGAAAGAGAAVSILTKATYLKDRERSLALQATAAALLAIAEAGGPRCCKQSVYLTLETTAEFLSRELNLKLPLQVHCESAARNAECKGERCRYWPRPAV